ncbi:GerAB/ArcD/ProY family transporter [Pseudalkalibacillus caeni]|uniref:Uncharacterized protein n=1 Tax=Exobacillus caeni TaxID=2574798 RepID=A0A5R9F5Z1_9BACL|nr:GerAB/ArcD/ProY family transporter [Pseudalkalibacillus caeni]TLS35225.1 hypothetical protein FCL54_21750 [Pseudalkalibacillus caeni]
MTKKRNKTITKLQAFFLIVQTQIGVGVLSLPFDVHKVAQKDGWISAFIAGIGVQLSIFLIWFLNKRFPSLHIFEINQKVLGKWVGSVTSLFYLVYYFGIFLLINLLATRIIKTWAFPHTPSWVFYLIFTFLITYICIETLRVIARFYVFVSLFIVLLIAISLTAYSLVDFRYIFPIGEAGISNILKGSKQVLLSMLGFEFLLFLYPFIEGDEKSILKTATLANVFVTVLYVFLIFTTLIFFTPTELNIVPEPLLYMLKSFHFRVLERYDLLFLSIWIVSVLTSLITYFYLTVKGMESFRKKRSNIPIYMLSILGYIILTFFPEDPFKLQRFSSFLTNLSYLFFCGFPLLLLIVSLLSKRKEGEGQA